MLAESPRPAPRPGSIHVDCSHKYPHRHGQHTTRQAHGCDCDACLHAAYRVTKAALVNGGTKPDFVGTYAPSWLPSTLIEALARSGVTTRQIAAEMGWSESRVDDLHYGTYKKVRKEVVHAIADLCAAHHVPLPRHPLETGFVDATGSRRRLQALARMGWSAVRIAEITRLDPAVLSRVKTGKCATVRASTRDCIRGAYATLVRQPLPNTPQVRMTRTKAARAGYPSPVNWRSGADMDDPDAAPCTATTCTARTRRRGV